MARSKRRDSMPKKKWQGWLKPEKLKTREELLKLVARTLYVLAVFSVLILIWLKSFHLAATSYAALPDIKGPGDLSAILFGSAQVCLFVISIVIAFFAIFGFKYFEGKIREAVKKEIAKRIDKVERELRGRSYGVLGYTIGESSVKPDFSAPTDEARLIEAIQYCDQAYGFLKGTDLPAEFMALNNLLIYSCAMSNRPKSSRSRRGYILEGAYKIKEAAEEHDNQNLLLTFCHTILEFSLEPREIEEACSILKVIIDKGSINEKQKGEVRYLTSLCNNRGLLIDPMA
jgi:hypothetical protein